MERPKVDLVEELASAEHEGSVIRFGLGDGPRSDACEPQPGESIQTSPCSTQATIRKGARRKRESFDSLK